MSVMEDLDRKAKQIKIPGPFDNRIAGFVKSMEDSRRELQNQIRGVEVIEEASKRYVCPSGLLCVFLHLFLHLVYSYTKSMLG